MIKSLASVVILTSTLTAPALAQTPAPPKPAPPTSVAEAQARLWDNAVKRWEAMLTKVVTMARDFPQEKADFRFHADTRTFLEEVWHETFDQQLFEARLKGTMKTIDTKKLYSGEGRPRDLKQAAGELETVVKEVGALLRGTPSLEVMPSLDFYIEHASVAYGKLASMYRANGLVPPVTKAAAERRTTGGHDHDGH